ncbi:NAD(P)H-dependent oxidoreductase [Ilyomonas limi]|uniref:NAD(P)H-dependent oxidoreductase n=1 Tax=Ilyomonas limi TaxID=2575867 RepID=A0A4U3KQI1_9BACT|nr:NAD(P)H-dependent oxidoreductase [Ilyomonas limi]
MIIVTPEYNNGCPASLQNAMDFLCTELETKNSSNYRCF